MSIKVVIFTMLMVLGLIPGCTPIKVSTCTQVPSVVGYLDMFADYAGKEVCIGASAQVTMPTNTPTQ